MRPWAPRASLSAAAKRGWDHAGSGAGDARTGCPGPLPSCPCGKPGVCPASRLGEEAQTFRAGLMGPHPHLRGGCSGCWAGRGLLPSPVQVGGLVQQGYAMCSWSDLDGPVPAQRGRGRLHHRGGAEGPGAPDSAGGLTGLIFPLFWL